MHPNPKFHVSTDAELLDRAVAIGFAHIFVNGAAGPMVVHAPVTRHGEQSLAFHIARANRVAGLLDGAALLLSIVGPDGYVSPNWYTRPGDQVPTWNYVAIEIEGTARALGEAELVGQLDALAATHEPRVNAVNPWTRDKMTAEPFGRMLRAIQGFAVDVTAVRGTTKLSQNKPPADRAAVVAGLEAAGNEALARAMR